jgi:hypothetical protein
MQVKRGSLIMAWWLLIAVAALSLVMANYQGELALTGLAIAATARPFNAPTPAGQSAAPDKPRGGTGVALGMGKEAVRTAWGQPAEIRKLRTCFGWQEEWVYRGDPERFGGSERILLFDEGEVLTAIK